MKGDLLRRARVPAAVILVLLAVPLLAVSAAGALGAGAPLQVSDGFRDQVRGSRDGQRPDRPSEFYFTRGIYSGIGRYWDRRGSWAIDYPKADRQFVFGLSRLTTIDAYPSDNAIRLADPELAAFPFLYVLEVGQMSMTEEEVAGLRRYLQAGGFLFIDDFWGSWQWRNFEVEIERVLPGAEIVELPMEHPVFHTFYDIEEVVQVPSIRIVNGGTTWEQDGYFPYVFGIFDDADRLMVLINWNTDLGDAWEWVDNPYYPIEYSNYAYQLAVNAIVYAMSH